LWEQKPKINKKKRKFKKINKLSIIIIIDREKFKITSKNTFPLAKTIT